MEFQKLVETRRSHRSYVPGKPVPRATVEKILTQASLAPSAFNQQGWKVIVVETQALKERMFKEACPQQQVLDSSAMLILCANVEQYKQLPEITAKSDMPQSVRDHIVKEGEKAHVNNPQLARDEALRSVSLFAMALMFAATDAGLGSGPMIGFDMKKMCELFNIRPPYFPAMLVSLGWVKDAPFAQGWRRPVSDFAEFI